jgi:hypothetical protein
MMNCVRLSVRGAISTRKQCETRPPHTRMLIWLRQWLSLVKRSLFFFFFFFITKNHVRHQLRQWSIFLCRSAALRVQRVSLLQWNGYIARRHRTTARGDLNGPKVARPYHHAYTVSACATQIRTLATFSGLKWMSPTLSTRNDEHPTRLSGPSKSFYVFACQESS